MPERVTAGGFGDSGGDHGLFDGALQGALVQEMTSALPGFAVVVLPGCREYPLPTQFSWGVGVFFFESIRKLDETSAVSDVALVL
jgi:hypothetical protein